jgi:hypothetical protein
LRDFFMSWARSVGLRKLVVGGMVSGGTARTGMVGGPTGERRLGTATERRLKSGLGVVGTGGLRGKEEGVGDAAAKGLSARSLGKSWFEGENRSMNDSRSVDIAEDTDIDLEDRCLRTTRGVFEISLIWGVVWESRGFTSFPLLRLRLWRGGSSLRLRSRSRRGRDGDFVK